MGVCTSVPNGSQVPRRRPLSDSVVSLDGNSTVSEINTATNVSDMDMSVYQSSSSVGTAANENRKYLDVKRSVLVLNARFRHGINADPDQFTPDAYLLSPAERAVIRNAIDDHIAAVIESDLNAIVAAQDVNPLEDSFFDAISVADLRVTPKPMAAHDDDLTGDALLCHPFTVAQTDVGSVGGLTESPHTGIVSDPGLGSGTTTPGRTPTVTTKFLDSSRGSYAASPTPSRGTASSQFSSHFRLPEASLRGVLDYSKLIDAVTHQNDFASIELQQFLLPPTNASRGGTPTRHQLCVPLQLRMALRQRRLSHHSLNTGNLVGATDASSAVQPAPRLTHTTLFRWDVANRTPAHLPSRLLITRVASQELLLGRVLPAQDRGRDSAQSAMEEVQHACQQRAQERLRWALACEV